MPRNLKGEPSKTEEVGVPRKWHGVRGLSEPHTLQGSFRTICLVRFSRPPESLCPTPFYTCFSPAPGGRPQIKPAQALLPAPGTPAALGCCFLGGRAESGRAGPQISLRNVLGRLEVATVEAVTSAWPCARKTGCPARAMRRPTP